MAKNRSITSFFGSNGKNIDINKDNVSECKESVELHPVKRVLPIAEPLLYSCEAKATKHITLTNQPEITNCTVICAKEYRPDLENYDPIEDACWLPNCPVPFLGLCRTFQYIEETSSTLKSTMIATNFFKSVILLSPNDFIPSLYMCMGEIAPTYEGVKLGIGDSILIQAVANTTGRKRDQIKRDITETGDLGIVAEKSKIRQSTLVKPMDLTVKKVFDCLREIASINGDKATERKAAKIQYLYSNCQMCESRYLIRILQKNLRIGLREPLILNAIAHALVQLKLTPTNDISFNNSIQDDMKTASLNIRNAYCVMPNFDILIPLLLEKGWTNIQDHCQINVGMPIKPMLAIPLNKLSDIYSRFGETITNENVVFEYKYDGERAQIHYSDTTNQLCCYSRNQENQTFRYPEISQLLPNIFVDNKVQSFIIDAEIVAFDNELGMIRPFQTLLKRKYKNVTMENIKVNVCVVAFDLLYLNGASLLDTPLRERIHLLREHFKEIDNRFIFAKKTLIPKYNDDTIVEAIDQAVKNQCEGLMAKDLSSSYQINKRSCYWVKLKKDYIDKVGDTLDLVVMGGYYGAGKRKGNYGGFLMGCYDPISDEIQSICRIGTGLSDAILTQHHEFFKNYITENPSEVYRFDDNHAADQWFEPIQVWEIKAADMSLSTIHQAAKDMIEIGKGVSLRFPRFIKVREDKNVHEASDTTTIVHLYKNQASILSAPIITSQGIPDKVDTNDCLNEQQIQNLSKSSDN